MKKTIYSIIIAGLALAFSACRKVDENNPANTSDVLTVTAGIVSADGTRVAYAFADAENSRSAIKPSWEVGDEIFGFDEDGDAFTFAVSSVDPDSGVATFDASGATGLNGTLYAVIYPGCTAEFQGSGAEKTLTVDLSSQSGSLDGNTPVIMCATGTISDNAVNFNFVNQTTIVGIYKMQVYNNGAPVAAGQSVTGVTLKGAAVGGTIKVKDGVLTLEAGTVTADLTAGVDFTTETDGFVNVDTDAIAPYFAVIPAANASLSIEADCGGRACSTSAVVTGKLAAGKYYYLGKKIYSGTVATVGTNGYASVNAAFAAATDGQTVKLVNDYMLDNQVIVKGKSVTLDLNGCTLTLDGMKRIDVGTNGNLTIIDSGTDGEINQIAAGAGAFAVSTGALVIKGGTVTSNSFSNATIVVNSDSGNGTSGNVTVSGGKVTSGISSAISVSGAGVLNVTGGEIEARSADAGNAIYLGTGSGNITISGGYLHSQKVTINISSSSQHSLALSGDCTVISTASNALYSSSTATSPNSTVAVTGGKYSSPGKVVFSVASTSATKTVYSVSSCIFNGNDIAATRLAPSCRQVPNTDPDTKTDYPKRIEQYIPQSDPVTLTIGSGDPQPYATVEAAVTEANNNPSSACLITINDNLVVTTATNVTNGTGVTLDLNDHTLTYSGTNRIRPATGGKLIIKDSGTNGTITNTTNTNLLYYTGGELVLQSGTLKPYGTSTGVVYVENAKFTMEGGTITDDGKNTRALTIGGSNTSTVIITGGSISGGNDVDNQNFGAIYVNNAKATCTIDGEDVTVTAPNIAVNNDNAIMPIVSVNSGALVLKKGTIGTATNPTENIGNITAVRVSNGTFTMEGGCLYARRHAMIFSGSGSASISGGRLATTVNGWSLIRFQSGSSNKLTISGGGFTVAGSGGKMFAGQTTGAVVPAAASVTVTGGFFDKHPEVNGVSVSEPFAVVSGSYTYDGKSYGFKVE